MTVKGERLNLDFEALSNEAEERSNQGRKMLVVLKRLEQGDCLQHKNN